MSGPVSTGFTPLDRAGYRRGMDLAYPPEAEEFRAEIAGWLKENLPRGGAKRAL